MHTSVWNRTADIFHSFNCASAAGALTATLDNAVVVDVGISEALGNVNVVTIPATAHGLEVGSLVYISATTNYNGMHKLISVATDTFNIVAPYVAETLAGTEKAVATIAADKDIQLVEVRLTLDASATQDTFTITLDSGLGDAYDILLHSQAMSGLSSYIWVLSSTERRMFDSLDKLIFAFANNDGRRVGLEVIYQTNK